MCKSLLRKFNAFIKISTVNVKKINKTALLLIEKAKTSLSKVYFRAVAIPRAKSPLKKLRPP